VFVSGVEGDPVVDAVSLTGEPGEKLQVDVGALVPNAVIARLLPIVVAIEFRLFLLLSQGPLRVPRGEHQGKYADRG
jgi:hypothetical protein